MSQKFSSEEDEKLIDLVKQHPALYQMKSRSYKDAITKNNSWRIISESIGKSEDDCKGRWKSIRDYYQRKRKEYINGSGSQIDDNNDNFLQRFKHLQFLGNTPIVERSRSTSNIYKRRNEEDDSVDLETDIEEKHCIAIIGNAQELSSTSGTDALHMYEPESAINRKRPRTLDERYTINEIEKGQDEKTTFHQSHSEPNESDPATFMFFKSIAITVSSFPPILKARAKAEIMNVISRYEVEALSNE